MKKLLVLWTLPFLFAGVVFSNAEVTHAKPGATGSTRCRDDYRYRKGVGRSCRLPNGLLKVKLAGGKTITTHGLDVKTVEGDTTTTQAVSSTRPPKCAPSGAYRFVIIYAYLSGRASRVDYFRPTIRTIIRKQNYLLNRESWESGGRSADLKVACNRWGNIEVRSVAVPGTDAGAIMSKARSVGYSRTTEKYAFFLDAGAPYAGVATFCQDDRRVLSNCSNFGPSYGIIAYGYWGGRTFLHEVAHTMGAVPYAAPDSSGASHCDGHQHGSSNNPSAGDVLCYQDGGPRWDSYDRCRYEEARMHFDRCHNDYFDAREEPGEWLASHWNIGWRGNRFIAFG